MHLAEISKNKKLDKLELKIDKLVAKYIESVGVDNDLSEIRSRAERSVFRQVFLAARRNQSKTAKALSMSRATFMVKMKDYRL